MTLHSGGAARHLEPFAQSTSLGSPINAGWPTPVPGVAGTAGRDGAHPAGCPLDRGSASPSSPALTFKDQGDFRGTSGIELIGHLSTSRRSTAPQALQPRQATRLGFGPPGCMTPPPPGRATVGGVFKLRQASHRQTRAPTDASSPGSISAQMSLGYGGGVYRLAPEARSAE